MTRIQTNQSRLDLGAIRARLENAKGREFWRSLEELAETPQFREYLYNEFTPGTSEWTSPLHRRDVLRLVGASLGLAGLTACTKQPEEKIVPYVRAPEEVVPGKPLFFATAFSMGGVASGLLVESHTGRPTKIEGNPDHPASLGATNAFAQASLLTMYDPDRSQAVIKQGRISSWVAFQAAVAALREDLLARKGAGFRILTETVTSPTLAKQLRDLLAEMPEARWHQYEPVNGDAARAGALIAFGQPVNPVYSVGQADVIVALDSDFLATGPAAVRYARDFAARRKVHEGGRMNRLYAVEATLSPTGAAADHRLSLTASEIEGFTRALASALGIAVPGAQKAAPDRWVKAVAMDLQKHRGASLVVAGDQQPAAVHALAHAINGTLGNAGKTVVYTDPVEADSADQSDSLRALLEDMKGGRVSTLLILGANPVFYAPADLQFTEHMRKVGSRIHLGLYDDETAELCHWHIPETHFLEAWSDARAYDGTVSLVQPLIAPLYGGKSAHEVLNVFAGKADRSGHDTVRAHWQTARGAAEFERWWRQSLHDGLIADTALAVRTPALRMRLGALLPAPGKSEGVELCLRPDPTIWDGRFANNAWLQELPKPLTKLTWDNAALISTKLAERMKLENGDVAELRFRGRAVEAPVWILPGHAENAVTLHFGYGRTRGGRVAGGAGVNAYALRASEAPWGGPGLEIRKTGRKQKLACTQDHQSMEGRNLVRSGSLDEYEKDHHFAHHGAHEPEPGLSLFPGFEYKGYSWGMAFDLSACTGCGACVVACQAENNISVVGKEQVIRGREMHWIRIDRYFEGGPDEPEVHQQPVACMHCDNAPCEVVCPVGATTHSDEGLNQMAYNRCVGTRYCSNNCPYKVRRFNFFRFADWTTESLKPMRNPDVTVRSRGVMEKCTYCVQRINHARIEAEKEDRKIRDGEVVTACQAVCPAQAIVFGDLNDPNSRVAKLKKNPLNYGILTELNTRPRSTYLARVRNPNPELERG
jgi:molybdopterin-containing oxidoreductase family iron-sulfur binding subunit